MGRLLDFTGLGKVAGVSHLQVMAMRERNLGFFPEPKTYNQSGGAQPRPMFDEEEFLFFLEYMPGSERTNYAKLKKTKPKQECEVDL